LTTTADRPPSAGPELLEIRRALISVSDKAGVVDFARALAARGVEILSTGGTSRALQGAGIAVTDVSAVTGVPEMMDGRVKTLHPAIHGGLLALRDDPGHLAAMQAQGIAGIDCLVVNLYPFETTVTKGAERAEVIENIDVGGPAMIRAAAKNAAWVAVLTDPDDYGAVLSALKEGGVPRTLRARLAAKAFQRTAAYDAAISAWYARDLGDDLPDRLAISGRLRERLRYGENPHQPAGLYLTEEAGPSVAKARQLQGKPLSYNNINDADAAFELVSDLPPEAPAVVIVKHANPCGAAAGADLSDAYRKAHRCDPVSAYGGIVAVNRRLDAAAAELISGIFTEVVVAPEADDEAAAIFAAKPNLRLLVTGGLADPTARALRLKSVAGGFLVQERDSGIVGAADLQVVTRRAPGEQEIADLVFAFRIAKHVKSNAIVYARDGATVGIGAGQMSRVDSARIAAIKAAEAATAAGLAEPLTRGSVVASDAFFPFADGLLAAAEAGATAVIQPGGSLRDAEVIAAADDAGLAMVFTGIRHFRH
jgi:phosphoribosylaminoimidazolecarboxamide formyltransferase/IMP cyclohydrolase